MEGNGYGHIKTFFDKYEVYKPKTRRLLGNVVHWPKYKGVKH